VLDYGTNDERPVDYPDLAAKGGRAVASGEAERGVFLCGTGLGVCMAANKVHGVRAAVLTDLFTAEMSRRHNDANVACLGARIHADASIARIVDVFLATPFDGGRHAARVAKIMALERSESAAQRPG
jgi:ribose 5-phosphate isomerase B